MQILSKKNSYPTPIIPTLVRIWKSTDIPSRVFAITEVEHIPAICKVYYQLCKSFRILAIFCGRQEEPAILISRLLLRMRRMYVASIRLDIH